MRRLRRRAALGLTLLLTSPGACAHDPEFANGEWHSARTGFRIGVPGATAVSAGETSTGEWKRFDLDGALLAYRRGGLENMSLQARCGRPVTEAAIMARHLVIGIPERTLREGGPREIAGRTGWLQTLDARLDGRTVRIKT